MTVSVSVLLLGAMVWFVLPKLPDWFDVWGYIRAMTGVEVIVLATVAVWNLATYWFATMARSWPWAWSPSAAVTVSTLLLRSEGFAHRAGEGAGCLMSRARGHVPRAPVDGWGHAATTFRTRVVGLVRTSWGRGRRARLPAPDLPGPDRPGRAHLRLLAAQHLGGG